MLLPVSCRRLTSGSISCVREEGVDPLRQGPKHLEGTGSSGDRRSGRRLSADAHSAPLILCHAPSIDGADCPRLVVCDGVCVGVRTQPSPGVFLFPRQAPPPAGRRFSLPPPSAHRRRKQRQLSLSPPGCLLVTPLSFDAAWLTCRSRHPPEELKGTAPKWSTPFMRRTLKQEPESLCGSSGLRDWTPRCCAVMSSASLTSHFCTRYRFLLL